MHARNSGGISCLSAQSFFDVDGTLLGAGHRIPPSALEALHAARQNGVRLFIATRPRHRDGAFPERYV